MSRLLQLKESFDELSDCLNSGDHDAARVRLELLKWHVYQELRMAEDIFARILDCKSKVALTGQRSVRIRVHPDTMLVVIDAVKALYEHDVENPVQCEVRIHNLPVEADSDVPVSHVEVDGAVGGE